ncbi:MAG TPA: PE family protein [Umezawaea sp.]|nr:PE family protein [Umezawaea sp.]
MTVKPEEVVRLKHKLEAVRDSVNDFVRDQRDALRGVPFADDEVSQDAAKDFAANADTAIQVARQFIDELDRTITGLDQAVTTYNLTDDTHAIAMQQLTKDH